jgi:Uma2 family endonuclease
MPSLRATAPHMYQVSIPTVETELGTDGRRVIVPAGISDLQSFHDWALGPDFPAEYRIDYLGGTIWVDLSMEELYSHNQIKAAIYVVLINLVQAARIGLFLPDRMRLSYSGARASVEPDGAFVSYDALRTGRVRELLGRRGGVMRLEGAVEMVLEVVSESSEEKDIEQLPLYYAAAGVQEFWRVDARNELTFEIMRLASDGYVPTDEPVGWWRSDVFKRSFRLAAGTDPLGRASYTLEVRP